MILQDDGGWIFIIWVLEYRIVLVVKFLIKYGVDFNMKDKVVYQLLILNVINFVKKKWKEIFLIFEQIYFLS